MNKQSSMTGRWLVCVSVAFSLLSASAVFGTLQKVLFADQTHITWGICVIGLIGTVASRWRVELNDWLCEHGIPILLGLLGTVIGFMAALAGLVDSNDIAKLAGVETAMSTTIVGLVTHLHLLIMQRLIR